MPTLLLPADFGLLPSQWFDANRPATEWTREEKLGFRLIEVAVSDYLEISAHGFPLKDPHEEFGEQDCRDLVSWFFDDHYGEDDDGVLTLRSICCGLAIERDVIRQRLRIICPPDQLVGRLKPRGERQSACQPATLERRGRGRRAQILAGSRAVGE